VAIILDSCNGKELIVSGGESRKRRQQKYGVAPIKKRKGMKERQEEIEGKGKERRGG